MTRENRGLGSPAEAGGGERIREVRARWEARDKATGGLFKSVSSPGGSSMWQSTSGAATSSPRGGGGGAVAVSESPGATQDRLEKVASLGARLRDLAVSSSGLHQGPPLPSHRPPPRHQPLQSDMATPSSALAPGKHDPLLGPARTPSKSHPHPHSQSRGSPALPLIMLEAPDTSVEAAEAALAGPPAIRREARLRQWVADLRGERQRLEDELFRCAEVPESSWQRVAELRNALETRVEELYRQRDTLEMECQEMGATQSRTITLEAIVRDLEMRIERQADAAELLESEAENAVRRGAMHEETAHVAEEAARRMLDDNEALMADNEALLETRLKLEERINSLREAVAAEKARQQDASTTQAGLKRRIGQLEEELLGVRQQLGAEQKRVVHLSQQQASTKSKLQKELCDLERSGQMAMAALEQERLATAALRERVEVLERDLERSQGVQKQMEEELDRRDIQERQSREAMEEEHQRLWQQMSGVQEERDQARAERTDLKKRLDETVTVSEDQRQRLEAMAASARERDAEAQSLESERDMARQHALQLQESAAKEWEYSQSYARSMEELREQMEELVEEKEGLREDLTAEQRFNQELGGIIKALRLQVEAQGVAVGED